MTLKVDIKVDFPVSRLTKQARFAGAGALNDSAFDARADLIKDMNRTFTIRNKWSERGFRVRKASKRSLEAIVGQQREYLLDQVVGGQRQRTAIPTPKMRGSNKRMIGRRRWPRSLRAQQRFFLAEGEGARMLYRRMGRRGRRIRLLWRLPTSDQAVKKRWQFGRAAENSVRRTFSGHMRRRFADALRTAR